MAWETKSRYYSGQGVVLMGDTDAAGNPTGLIPVGNVSSLKISVTASNLEHKESQSGQRGTDLRLSTEVKCGVDIVMESVLAENMAVALRASVVKKPGAAVAAELSKAYLGKVMPLKHAKVSLVVIKDTESTPNTLIAYTLGMDPGDWDYMVNAESGSIMWATTPNTVTLTEGDAVTVAYTYAAQQHVDPLTMGIQEKFLRFEGLNTADDMKPVIIEVFRFSPDPLKELDLINDTLSNFALSSSALLDTRRPAGESKYFRQIYVD